MITTGMTRLLTAKKRLTKMWIRWMFRLANLNMCPTEKMVR